MELNFSLKPNQRGKTFARYIITHNRPAVENTRNLTKHSGFYYIGKNSSNIEKLVSIFKNGYASEAIENAKAELKHCLTQEKNAIPEIIFCESKFDIAAIKRFSLFLSNHASLSSIPFVLDASNLSEDELDVYKQSKVADEIIFLDQADEKNLSKKIQFLRKVKVKTAGLVNTPYVERNSFPAILNNHLILKRAFDIIVSVFLLCLLSPLFLLIALAIIIESKGPVFYISKRAGKGYKIFDFYKFRTMHVGADKSMDEYCHLNQYKSGKGKGPLFIKINNDPRITKVGSFLRNTSLDELPQLINVFLGDMSLVGNRPLPLYEAATLTTDECAKRFLAPAGITGLWQITKRGKENMSIEERINLDIDYADKRNFMYDLWIMANTPSALIQKASS